jgi:hypothetical protein
MQELGSRMMLSLWELFQLGVSQKRINVKDVGSQDATRNSAMLNLDIVIGMRSIRAPKYLLHRDSLKR